MMLISDRIQLVVAAAAAQAAAASVGSAAVVPAAVCGDDVWPECAVEATKTSVGHASAGDGSAAGPRIRLAPGSAVEGW